MHDTTLHSLTRQQQQQHSVSYRTTSGRYAAQRANPDTPSFFLSRPLSFLWLSSQTTLAPPRAYTTTQQQQHLPTTLQSKKQTEEGTT